MTGSRAMTTMTVMIAPDARPPRRVVIVGAGVGALEAVLALHDLAGDLVRTTVIAPEAAFSLRALDVGRPFGHHRAGSVELAGFVDDHGGTFRRTTMLEVDADRRLVRCSTGEPEPYDLLLVAVGAPARAAFDQVMTFGPDPLELTGLLADVEEGFSHRVAFVVPPGTTWPLPLYELALLTAQDARGMDAADVQLHLVTPEAEPLAVFGPEASEAVLELLDAAGITVHAGAQATVVHGRTVDLGNGDVLEVERVVALPAIQGPRLVGLPCDARGFLPVDDHGRVVGVDGVYAAGDASDRPVKQGGLACQQADAAAEHMALVAGARVEALPYDPVLRARLLTAHSDRFLQRAGETAAGEVSREPLWWPPVKVAGRYLGPYLEASGLELLTGPTAATG